MNLKEIFSKTYLIPPYQRNYVWESEQIREFLDDIVEDYQNNPDSVYFTGSLILVPKKKVYEIVDGQQRMITFSLLFLAISELLDDEERKKEIISYLVSKDPYLPYGLRIIVNNVDKEDYLDLFLHKIKRDNFFVTHLNLIKSYLKEKFKKQEDLLSFFNYLENNVSFVFIVCDESNAYILFERLNRRGLNLSEKDLIKNYCISLFSTSGEHDKILNYFNNLEKTLKCRFRSNQKADRYFNTLFKYCLIIKKKTKIQEKELFLRFKELCKTINDVVDFLKLVREYFSFEENLEDRLKLYIYLEKDFSNSADKELFYDVYVYLFILKELRLKQHYPLLFLLFKKNYDPEKKWKLVELLFSFLFIYIIEGKTKNEIEQTIPKLCACLDNDNLEKYEKIILSKIYVSSTKKSIKLKLERENFKAKNKFFSYLVYLEYFLIRDESYLTYSFVSNLKEYTKYYTFKKLLSKDSLNSTKLGNYTILEKDCSFDDSYLYINKGISHIFNDEHILKRTIDLSEKISEFLFNRLNFEKIRDEFCD